jgi:hypothetical protein
MTPLSFQTRVIPVLAKPKAGTHKRLSLLEERGGDAAIFLRTRSLWVPVFACGETGMTLGGWAA